MELHKAQELAIHLMGKHKLDDRGWYFDWDRGVRRFGCTHYGTKRITLSRHLTELNSEKEVKQVILHEIAHALAGFEAAHGPVWASTVRQIGGSARRTHSAETPPSKLIATCRKCGRHSFRERQPNRGVHVACVDCCRKYNRGRYSVDYALNYFPNTQGVKA